MTSSTYLDVVIVNIQSDSNGLHALSEVYPVKRSGSVAFVVQDPVRVVVKFNKERGSCLVDTGPFHLDGSDPAKAGTGPMAVLHDAKGRYRFTVEPDTGSGFGAYTGGPGEHEAKQGEVDVSPDYYY